MAKEGEINYLKKAGSEAAVHAMNKPFSDAACKGNLFQMGAIMSLLPPPPAKILDLGCGSGWTSAFLAKRGYNVVGQDIAEDMIQCANKIKDKEKLDHLEFVISDYEKMNYKNEFDCVLFYDALHHAVDEALALRMAFQALKPGGSCVTSEPGEGHTHSPEALEAVEKFNVTEKDMPAEKIIEIGKKIGFNKFRIYPNAVFVGMTLFDESTKPVFRFLYSFSILKYFALFLKLIFSKDYQNILVMTRPGGEDRP